MAPPIDHQQLLFTASLVDLPLSNAILKEKKCVLVVSLCLKRIWPDINFDQLSATVSVVMVARRCVIETPLYAMQDGNKWLKVNTSHGWLRARGAPILHRKVSKGLFFAKIWKSPNWQNTSSWEFLAYYWKSLIRAQGPFLHRSHILINNIKYVLVQIAIVIILYCCRCSPVWTSSMCAWATMEC